MWQVEDAWFCLSWTIIVRALTPHWPWWPTSRWWRWWWCSTRRWSQPARWRWRGRPGSCRPATATPPWSLSSTGCHNLTRGSEGPVTVSPTNLPLVSWRSKKNRIGTENTILVNQADNTSHFALLSETKEKFYHCKFGEVAMTGECVEWSVRVSSLLTAPVESHGMSDGVVSVHTESHQHVSRPVSDHQLTKPDRKIGQVRKN